MSEGQYLYCRVNAVPLADAPLLLCNKKAHRKELHDECGKLVDRYRQAETKLHKEKPITLAFYTPKILHDLLWD
jgi:hypothetical protein